MIFFHRKIILSNIFIFFRKGSDFGHKLPEVAKNSKIFLGDNSSENSIF